MPKLEYFVMAALANSYSHQKENSPSTPKEGVNQKLSHSGKTQTLGWLFSSCFAQERNQRDIVQIMKFLSKVFVSSIPIAISQGVLFQYIDNELILKKCFQLFREARPAEYNYSLSQLMILIKIVNIILGDSYCSTIGIKCHFPPPPIFSLFFEHYCTRKLKCLFATIFTMKEITIYSWDWEAKLENDCAVQRDREEQAQGDLRCNFVDAWTRKLDQRPGGEALWWG